VLRRLRKSRPQDWQRKKTRSTEVASSKMASGQQSHADVTTQSRILVCQNSARPTRFPFPPSLHVPNAAGPASIVAILVVTPGYSPQSTRSARKSVWSILSRYAMTMSYHRIYERWFRWLLSRTNVLPETYCRVSCFTVDGNESGHRTCVMLLQFRSFLTHQSLIPNASAHSGRGPMEFGMRRSRADDLV
jgi:hypothetical protein